MIPVAALHDTVYDPVALLEGPVIGPGTPGTHDAVPTQLPNPSQWSPDVHALLSLQVVPLALGLHCQESPTQARTAQLPQFGLLVGHAASDGNADTNATVKRPAATWR